MMRGYVVELVRVLRALHQYATVGLGMWSND
jgi:hypothetical protein